MLQNLGLTRTAIAEYMPKFNPFGAPKKLEFAPVGSEETGVIYLLKRDRLKVKENPVDLQTADRRQALVIALQSEAAEKLAIEQKISEEEAIKWFFPQSINGTEVLPRAQLTRYLDTNQKTLYYEILGSSSSKYKVATLFMQHRLGYHVTVSEPIKAQRADIEVEPLRWDIAIGEKIEFDGFRATVTKAADMGDERIYVEPLPQKLAKGAVGFLVDIDTNSKKIGLSSWSEKDTQELDEAQVNAIYAFYQDQVGLRQVEEEEGKSQSPTSNGSSNQNQLTGSSATAESNGTELQTLNSQSKDLEIATVS